MLDMKLHDYLLKKISNHAIKIKVNITVSKKYREPIDVHLQDLFIICFKTKRTFNIVSLHCAHDPAHWLFHFDFNLAIYDRNGFK